VAGAEVTLIPKDIPRKRRWLWRFPIGIKLVDPTSVAICLEEIRDAAVKQAEKETKEAKKGDEKAVLSSDKAHTRDSAILYLLPRSDREKEDWYWRLMAATGRNPFPPERPNLSANLSTLNVLVHRICYDVLVEPAWEDVIRRKIQKKLSIIKLPYYIEELQITEMDLGKNIPIISNVSERPDINDRGIWVEMDFEYHGTVHMTLQTKLNLMKLKKGGEDQV
jgi:Maintenance of mitochondrial morphology protein 1